MGEMPAEDARGGGAPWTDEMHTSYLNSMEASFVSCMLFGGQFTYAAAAAGSPPLDRCLPDGADSTADCPAGNRGMRRTSSALPREGRIGTTVSLARRPDGNLLPHAIDRFSVEEDCYGSQKRRGFLEGLRRTRKRLQRPHAAPRREDDQVVPEFEMMTKSGENARLLHASGVVPPAAADDRATVEKEKDDLPRFR